jgi:hypothetical protein
LKFLRNETRLTLQKYHDDGEHGLGPTISTISLGCSATMSIRMKGSYFGGIKRSGGFIDAERPPIPGCESYEERRKFHHQLVAARESGVDATEITKMASDFAKSIKLSGKVSTTAWLNMHISHGDIVMMHGALLQQAFEVRSEVFRFINFSNS